MTEVRSKLTEVTFRDTSLYLGGVVLLCRPWTSSLRCVVQRFWPVYLIKWQTKIDVISVIHHLGGLPRFVAGFVVWWCSWPWHMYM